MKETIISIHQSMEKLTLEAGVAKKKYDSVIVDLEEFTDAELEALALWLTMVQKDQYKSVKEIKGLLKDEYWERYKSFGVKGLREQDLLKEAQKELKKIWDYPYRTEKQKD